MFKKISTITLLIILGALVLVYLGIEFLGKKERSSSFREKLVEVDTSKVSTIKLYGNDTLHLDRRNSWSWQVENSKGEMVEAQSSSVRSLLNTLMSIKPSRIVTKDKEKWSEYNVDTAGTRIIVQEGDKKTLDLIVGRFGFNQNAMQQQQMQMGGRGMQQFYTYVRLNDENEVYVADQFMSMSLSTDATSYRNTRIWQLTTDSINSIQYQYPADSGLVLQRSGEQWQVNGNTTDSASVVQYLNQIRNLNASGFADDVNPAELENPIASIAVAGAETAHLQFYPHSRYNLLVTSNRNPSTVFADPDSVVYNKVIVGKDEFYRGI